MLPKKIFKSIITKIIQVTFKQYQNFINYVDYNKVNI